MNEDLMLFIVAPLALVGTGYLAYWHAKAGNKQWLFGLVVAWLGFTAFMYAGLVSVTTIDWGAYLMVLITVSLPSAVGLVIGAIVGWVRGRRASL